MPLFMINYSFGVEELKEQATVTKIINAFSKTEAIDLLLKNLVPLVENHFYASHYCINNIWFKYKEECINSSDEYEIEHHKQKHNIRQALNESFLSEIKQIGLSNNRFSKPKFIDTNPFIPEILEHMLSIY